MLFARVADVAQWLSSPFVRERLEVRLLSSAPVAKRLPQGQSFCHPQYIEELNGKGVGKTGVFPWRKH